MSDAQTPSSCSVISTSAVAPWLPACRRSRKPCRPGAVSTSAWVGDCLSRPWGELKSCTSRYTLLPWREELGQGRGQRAWPSADHGPVRLLRRRAVATAQAAACPCRRTSGSVLWPGGRRSIRYAALQCGFVHRTVAAAEANILPFVQGQFQREQPGWCSARMRWPGTKVFSILRFSPAV